MFFYKASLLVHKNRLRRPYIQVTCDLIVPTRCYNVRQESTSDQGFMKPDDNSEIKRLLRELREEHRDLDMAIERMIMDPWQDQLRLRRLKKRKVQLKDLIAKLESRLIPDLDA